jgi:hypothetical protein
VIASVTRSAIEAERSEEHPVSHRMGTQCVDYRCLMNSILPEFEP